MDEKELARTEVKYDFIEHLSSLKGRAQIIILDNTDPPANIASFAKPVLFSGPRGMGRSRFFELKPQPREVSGRNEARQHA